MKNAGQKTRNLSFSFLSLFFFFSIAGYGAEQELVNETFSTIKKGSNISLGSDILNKGFKVIGTIDGYVGALKFITTSYLQLEFKGTAQTLSFDLGGNNAFSGTTKFKTAFSIQESEDGIIFTDVKKFTTSDVLPGTKTITGFSSKSRFIRWAPEGIQSTTYVSMKNVKLTGNLSTPSDLAFEKTGNQQVLLSAGSFSNPAKATNSTGAITYSVNNNANIDSNGTVTFTRIGIYTVTATQAAGGDFTETSTSYTLEVLPSLLSPNLRLEESEGSYMAGKTFKITALSESGGIITYTSGNPAVATVTNDGNVTAIAPGNTVITVTQALLGLFNSASVSYNLTVTEIKPEIVISPISLPPFLIPPGKTEEKTITVSGTNLKGDITFTISGTNAALFSVSPSSITPTNKLVTNTTVKIVYQPDAEGEHSATLTIQSTGTDNITIPLSGTGQAAQKGEKGNPYSITEILSLTSTTYPKNDVWVKGYIRGIMNNNTSISYTPPFSSSTNIILSDNPEATEIKDIIPVQLSNGTSAQTGLNLNDHPDNLGMQVIVFGTVTSYYSKNGVKNTSDFQVLSQKPDLKFPETAIQKNKGEVFTLQATSDSQGTITYSSSNSNVASVNTASGEVTALEEGSAKIVATQAAYENFVGSTAEYTLTVISVDPKVTVDKTVIDNFSAVTGQQNNQTVTISGSRLKGNISLSLSGTDAGQFSVSPEILIPENGTINNAVITISYAPQADGTHTALLTISTEGALPQTVELTGKVLHPSLSANVESLSFNVKIGNTNSKAITVSGEYLVSDVSIALSGKNAGMFSVTPESIARGTGSIKSTVTVKYSPAKLGSHTALLTLSSEGVSNVTISLNGTGVNAEKGEEKNPYSVAEVRGNNTPTKTNVWLKGYIVGSYNNALVTDPTKHSNTNIVLADNPDESNKDNITVVKLETTPASLKAAVNLKDNPQNVGKSIFVKGNIELYFSMQGMQGTSAYKWAPENMDIADNKTEAPGSKSEYLDVSFKNETQHWEIGENASVSATGLIIPITENGKAPEIGLKKGSTLTSDVIRIKRLITPGKWHFVHFPYTMSTEDIFINGTQAIMNQDFRIRKYDGHLRTTTGSGWVVVNEPAVFNANEGFTIAIPNEAQPTQIEFRHDTPVTLNGGDATLTAKAYPTEDINNVGWNLIGSPLLSSYTKTIDQKLTIYKYNYTTKNYDATVAIEDDVFAPFTPWFMQVEKDQDEIINFPLLATKSILPKSVSPVPEIESKIVITIDGQDAAKIFVYSESSDDFVINEDALKLRISDSSVSSIYFIDKKKKELATTVIPSLCEEINMGIITGTKGSHEIALRDDSYSENIEVWLQDKDTGKNICLSKGKYTFISNSKIPANERFVLKTEKVITGVQTNKSDEIRAFFNNSTLHIKGISAGSRIDIFNTAGKLVWKGVSDTVDFIKDIPLEKGIYILYVSGNETDSYRIKVSK